MSGKSQGNLFLEKVRENFVELPIFHIFSLKKRSQPEKNNLFQFFIVIILVMKECFLLSSIGMSLFVVFMVYTSSDYSISKQKHLFFDTLPPPSPHHHTGSKIRTREWRIYWIELPTVYLSPLAMLVHMTIGLEILSVSISILDCVQQCKPEQLGICHTTYIGPYKTLCNHLNVWSIGTSVSWDIIGEHLKRILFHGNAQRGAKVLE